MVNPPDKFVSRAAAPAAGRPESRSAPSPDPRQERLARALRDNLKKRKAQQRQRAAGVSPASPLPASGADHPGGE